MDNDNKFYALCFYTLQHTSSVFLHQHVVDAYAAQTADSNTKPIKIFFALAGLYLLIDKKYTGKQVQEAHIKMATKPKNYPEIVLPKSSGEIDVSHVLTTPPGALRDEMIYKWCAAVWTIYANQHQKIRLATESFLQES